MGQGQLLLQGFDLQPRIGQAAFALAQFQAGVQPGVDAVLHQTQGLRALGQQTLRHTQLIVQTQQLKVAARHMAGQQHAGGIGIRLRGARIAQCGIERCAVFAKEIQLPTTRQLRLAGLVD